MTLTVVIPVHSSRIQSGMLERALKSVHAQTLPADEVLVIEDDQKLGAAKTRQRGLDRVTTDWVTFLDSDDVLKPNHFQDMMGCALAHEADLVYPWYEVVGGSDHMAVYFGKPWDPKKPRLTTIVTLVRTELAQEVGFIHTHDGTRLMGEPAGEDWFFICGCNSRGAKIVHLPKKTWYWHHHGNNTSGNPNKGDARTRVPPPVGNRPLSRSQQKWGRKRDRWEP